MTTATAVREYPLLMNADMVRATLAGVKTQTRRIMKRNTPFQRDGLWEWYPGGPKAGFHAQNGDDTRFSVPSGWAAAWCPYGMPGDRLWVRETWGRKEFREYDPSGAYSMATGECEIVYRAGGEAGYGEPTDGRWRPSIHMPRWASRITLEVTEVRVERLQQITEEDAKAEGALAWISSLDGRAYDVAEKAWRRWSKRLNPHASTASAVGAFAVLWEQIYGPGSWEADPWLWVVSFRRISPETLVN